MLSTLIVALTQNKLDPNPNILKPLINIGKALN